MIQRASPLFSSYFLTSPRPPLTRSCACSRLSPLVFLPDANYPEARGLLNRSEGGHSHDRKKETVQVFPWHFAPRVCPTCSLGGRRCRRDPRPSAPGIRSARGARDAAAH